MMNTANTMVAGTKVRIVNEPDFTGRIAEVCLSEPFKGFSTISGAPITTWMVRLVDAGRFQGRSFTINSECLQVVA